MKRREFLRILGAVLVTGGFNTTAIATIRPCYHPSSPESIDSHIRDYLYKMRQFDRPFVGDVYLEGRELDLLASARSRLRRIQRIVGHGNFYLLSFDEALLYARNYSRIGHFPPDELEFLERIFHEDGARYGFRGQKPLADLTYRIRRRDVVKIRGTGNYLYRGRPQETFARIKQDLGDKVILTSGVRSVIKQFMLFLDKAHRSRGNLSLASRSLAPPGYSYHGVGDFDVGQAGFGSANFSSRFADTPVFKELQDRGYIRLRYPKGNLLGVRFEPWHIKVM